ncbi:MAG: 3-oxoacyl-ACP reductase [Deltaproteobacteria bacterium]|nr:MAG: 3-oxoacyl-ACP reductase [Deltaproteobacteria bacterium]
MDLGITDRVALVAASSRGLGFEAARSLAAEGVRLVICGRDEERLQQAAGKLRQEGTRVLAVACDLTEEAQVEKLVEQARQHFGRIDILVANCGGPPPGQFLQHDSQAWRRAVDLNLMSTVFLCRLVVPQMQERGWGRVVLMTSITVKQPLEGLVLSNSVRAAVVGLGKTLAAELGPSGVLVNCVCPGYFLTDRVSNLAESAAARTGESPQAFIDSWARQGVLGRIGDPAEFGPLVAFLCSERASYLTGAALAIDGGLCRSLL